MASNIVMSSHTFRWWVVKQPTAPVPKGLTVEALDEREHRVGDEAKQGKHGFLPKRSVSG